MYGKLWFTFASISSARSIMCAKIAIRVPYICEEFSPLGIYRLFLILYRLSILFASSVRWWCMLFLIYNFVKQATLFTLWHHLYYVLSTQLYCVYTACRIIPIYSRYFHFIVFSSRCPLRSLPSSSSYSSESFGKFEIGPIVLHVLHIT